MTQLSADSITMRFGTRRVLTDVYLEAQAGEVIGIVGRNGSGKSTLYKCLLGLHPHSTGFVRIDGRHVSKRAAPRYFSWLPQDSYLPTDMRLGTSANLVLGKDGSRTLLEEDARARSLMMRKAGELSAGEVRYIECLLALSLARPVILLDEPFTHVEPIYCETLQRRMREAAVDRVVMVCDHLHGNVRAVSTRILALRDGTLRNAEEDDAWPSSRTGRVFP